MTPPKARVFGMAVGIDPKILVAALLVVAGFVYYFNARSDERPAPAGAASPVGDLAVQRPIQPNAAPAARSVTVRRSSGNRTSSRVGLKLVPIDGSRGDVDPTLKLQLLDRVRNVPPAAGLRNLFEGHVVVMAQNLPPVLKGPILPPKPAADVTAITGPPPPPPPPPFSIPLKYYGFAKPQGRALDSNRGLFLDGDNILMGGEGDVLEKRYLIVALTPNSARLEDTQMKQGQDVPVTSPAQQQ